MENTEWEEVKGNSDIWLPEVGDSIKGVIVEKREGIYGIQAIIETSEGTRHTTPSHKVLQNRLADCKVGDEVKIRLERQELPTIKGRQGTKIYKVFKKNITEEMVE